jgi:hypothetical protein
MIACSQCQTPLPKWRALCLSFRVRCPSCDVKLHASAKAARRYLSFLALAILVFIALLKLVDFLFPEPSLVDWIPALYLLIILIGPSLLLWRSGDYSHQNPRFKFLGVKSIVWRNLCGMTALALVIYLVFQSPSLRLPWQLPENAEVVNQCEITQVRLTRQQFEALIDKMELRNCLQADGTYLKSGSFFTIRVSYEDGQMLLEEWSE